jgi:hypothetical protein
MKLFLRNIIVFTFGVVLFLIAPSLFLSKYDNIDKDKSENHNIISLQTKSSFDSLDILFIGNSYCYSSINTNYLDSLNINSFNLGIATTGVQFYELLIHDYINNTKTPPKKVLLLVTPMTFSSKSDNYSAYPIHRYLENEKSNLEIAAKYSNIGIGELISMHKKSLQKACVNIYEFRENQNQQRFNQKGFFPSNIIVNDTIISNTEPLYTSLRNDTFDKSKVEDLLRTANYIKQKGSEVIFFELPTNLLTNYFNNSYLSNYQKSLEHINANFKLISIDQNLFSMQNYRNIDHMNSSGAKIATKEILKLLE